MVRWSYGLLVTALLFGCGSGKETARDERMLLGPVSRAGFFNQDFPRFQARYDTVAVSAEVTGLIADFHDGADCLVFLGTWCSDSYREVPAFLKIADEAGIDSTRIRYYALDRDKVSPAGYEQEFGIELVPTFIFLRDGKEIGRIIEHSDPSMEDQMLQILIEGGE